MRRRDFIKAMGLGAIGLALPGNAPAITKPAKPNFIFILSDDQNWDGLSLQMDTADPRSKDPYVQTPCIAELAGQGMRFTDAYSPSPVCSPTRISILTGMSPANLHWTKAGPNMRLSNTYKLIPPQTRTQIDTSEQTLAECLKKAGYTTAHYGKWHLHGGGPEAHGFDESDGDTDNWDAAGYTAPNPVDIFGMSGRAVRFMEKAAGNQQPFFIQLSYYALHYAQNALPETVAKYRRVIGRGDNRRIHQTAIAENLDTGVGMVLDAVDRLNIADNTYIIYMSDNGGDDTGSGRTIRGGKGGLQEGGIRVPFVIRGPGIAANSICRTPIIGYDLFPTLCRLAGVGQGLPPTIEGGDFSHLLKGGNEPIKRLWPGLPFHFPHYQEGAPQSAYRLGDYKIILNYEDERLNLFNLKDDPGERKDLSAEMPDKKAELEGLLYDYLASVGAGLPKANPDYDSTLPRPTRMQPGPPTGNRMRRRRLR